MAAIDSALRAAPALTGRAGWSRPLRRLTRSAVVMGGAVGAALIVGMALFANLIAPYPPDEQNFDLIETAPWISVFPGIAIMVTVLAFNLLGDALRDALDPRARR